MGVTKGSLVYLRIVADTYFAGLYQTIMQPLLEEYNRTDANKTSTDNKNSSSVPTPDYRYYFMDVFMPVKIQGIPTILILFLFRSHFVSLFSL